MKSLKKVSEILQMDKDELEKEGIKSFLNAKLRSVETEIFRIAQKYGIKSVEELDEKLKQGLVEEEDVLPDFQELDYFESQREQILKAMEAL